MVPPGPPRADLRQAGGDRVGGVQAGGEIGQRHAGLDRGAVRFAGHAHHAGRSLDGDVEATFGATRTVLPESRDRAVDERGLARSEPVPAKAQALHGPGAAVLQQHLGLQHELARDLQVGRLLEVQRDRALAAVEAGEVLAVAAGQRWPGAHGVTLGRFDLDHLGAEIGQQHAGERPGGDLAELHHPHARQRPARGGRWRDGRVGSHEDRAAPRAARSASRWTGRAGARGIDRSVPRLRTARRRPGGPGASAPW